jgi:hypothetical protein
MPDAVLPTYSGTQIRRVVRITSFRAASQPTGVTTSTLDDTGRSFDVDGSMLVEQGRYVQVGGIFTSESLPFEAV